MIRILMATAALLAAPACTAQNVDDTDVFSRDMATRLSEKTGKAFVVVGPLALRVKGAKPGEMTFYVDRIYQFCQHNSARDCEASKANFAASTAEAFTDLPPISADRLRIVVRSDEYCRQIPGIDKNGAAGPLHKPLTDGLCVAMMVDYPRTRKSVSPGDLTDIKLTPDTAWNIALAQTLKETPRIGDFTGGEPLTLQGGDYVPSVILDIEAWRALAKRTPGGLIMVVPDDNFVIVYDGMPADKIAGLQKLVRESSEAAERGISPFVYRWNGNCWSVVR